MPFYLKSKKLDFSTGDEPVAVINQKEAEIYGIQPHDKILLKWSKHHEMTVDFQFTKSKVEMGHVGLFREVWRGNEWIDDEVVVEVIPLSRPASIEAIKKKMLGQALNYEEIYSIIKDIATDRLTDIETTYYAASGYIHPYSLTEMEYMVKAMAETGEMMNLSEKVVDKHSIGGIPNNRTTMVVIPIIASLGLCIPKTSSRAITSPSGTADTMEVLAPVDHTMKKIKEIIKKTGACLVWGGGLALAPADDKIIEVSRPLAMESYDKMVVSIMAKKVAMGVDFLVIDLPYGPTAKVKDLKLAKTIANKFVAVGEKFKIKVKVVMTEALEPIGRGVGPALEARDVLRVLQQHELRPRDLENKAIYLAGELLELKGFCHKGQGKKLAEKQIKSGAAWQKMNEIIVAQGGKNNLKADSVALGALRYEIHAQKSGKVVLIDNKAINEICMNLGAPHEKIAGMHFHIDYGEKVKKGDKLFTLYAKTEDRLNLGLKALENYQVVVIK
ncbi:MAG: thymidine phosphorylase [Patescibacteria group bacterium]|jgi:AMP phosphorylase